MRRSVTAPLGALDDCRTEGVRTRQRQAPDGGRIGGV